MRSFLARPEVFTVINIQMVGYQRFERPCYFHLQGEVSGAWKWTSLFYMYIHVQASLTSFWSWRQHGPPKHWYPITSLHGVHKTTI